jgi:hypothetical protein
MTSYGIHQRRTVRCRGAEPTTTTWLTTGKQRNQQRIVDA